MTNKTGYSLFESMVVLLILSTVLLIISIQPWKNLTDEIEERIFFDDLTSHLRQAQQLAILQNKTIVVRFREEADVINIVDPWTWNHIATLQTPDHIDLQTKFEFNYSQSGRVDGFKTIYFYDSEDNKQIYLVLQLGNGQFEIRE